MPNTAKVKVKMHASCRGRVSLWACMKGDPIFLFHFTSKYKIKFIYKKIQRNPILKKK